MTIDMTPWRKAAACIGVMMGLAWAPGDAQAAPRTGEVPVPTGPLAQPPS